MSQHTPGPWMVYKRKNAKGQLTGGLPEITGPGGLPVIADIRWNGHNEEHGQANARLIAAAPRMLELLQMLMFKASLNMTHIPDQWTIQAADLPDGVFQQARALLKEIEG